VLILELWKEGRGEKEQGVGLIIYHPSPLCLINAC
jgi:hypothetical protein